MGELPGVNYVGARLPNRRRAPATRAGVGTRLRPGP
jgi:hypothetical protein